MPIKKFEPVVDDVSLDEHLSLASKAVRAGLVSMKEAAEHLAAAEAQGATQRQMGEATGKSAGWVNGLLKWRKAGYPSDTPFGPPSKKSRESRKKPSVAVQSTEQDDDWGVDDDDSDLDDDAADERSSPHRQNVDVVKNNAEKSESGEEHFSEDVRQELVQALKALQTLNSQSRSKAALEVNRILARVDMSWEQLLVPAKITQRSAA